MPDLLGDPGEDDTGTVFRDTITLALAGFVALVILLLPHLAPKARQVDSETPTDPGNVMIEAGWPDGLDADVDLWVQGPGDIPVGYSNKGGGLFNLLRDDLGHQLDVSGRNYEVAYSRGLIAGEYTVNAHLYRNRSGSARIPVTVTISVKPQKGSLTRQILVSKADLGREGQELTVFRFRLNAAGQLVNDSVHSVYKPLRSGVKS